MKHTNHAKTLLTVYLPGLCEGKYTLKQASESTGYSVRHLSSLKKAYQEQGFSILENKNKGRIPVNKIPAETRDLVAYLYGTKRYRDVNFRFFQECLKEFEDINISYPTVLSIMKEYNIKSPESRKLKKKETVHRPRIRRANAGDLIQIDGTPYAWFYKFGDTRRYCLTGAIDDATGKITGLYMTENECLYGYLEILRQTCTDYGVPREIYSDRAAIFCFTPRNKKELSVHEQLQGLHTKKTQWQRILGELHIKQILAWSPQAKGRIERLWGTLQGRLPLEFFMHKIDSIEKANKYLEQYVKKFNAQFSREPADPRPYWRPIDTPTLDATLCAQFPRQVYRSAIHFQSCEFAVIGWEKSGRSNGVLCISEKGITVKMEDGLYYPVEIVDWEEYGYSDPGSPNGPVQSIMHRYLYSFAKEISV